MRAFKGFKVWVAVLLVATASWAQVLNMDDLKSQIDAFNLGSADMTITIGADFNITSLLEIDNNGYTLTLQSSTTPPRQLTRAVIGNLFSVKKGSLTLQKITIDGSNVNAPYQTNAHGSLVFVGDGGTLNMKDGATLQNNTIRDDNGSGVYVDSRGTFNMSGGKITGNKTNLSGGGVYIYALRATFNMSGGVISGNSCGTSATSYSGGVHFANTPLTTDTDPDKTASVFRLGGTAVIKDNTKGNGKSSNVYMAGSRYITLGDGTDGVPAPTGGMEVWITKVAESGLFVKEGAKPPNPPDLGDARYFQADAGSQVYYEAPGKLLMKAGYDISLSPESLKFMEIFDYTTQPEHEITVTNIGGTIGKLTIYLSGENADNFELDLTNISNGKMIQNAFQKFTVKPKLGLKVGTYNAFVLVSATEDIDGLDGPVIMRRLDVEFSVKEYVEDRTLYFNQSDGKFYASNLYTKIDSLPAHEIFAAENEIPIPTSWNAETNTLKIYGFNWTTTAPYSLYFSQPTPVTLELVGDNSFVSNRVTDPKDYSAGIVSRSSLTITGDGNLITQGGKANTGSYGVFSQALTINSGTFTASGDATAMKVEKDIVLRTPPEDYDWWYPDDATKGTGAFTYNPSYKWIKIKVPPPLYEVGASVDNNEPLVNTDVKVTLTVKDITTGKTYESIDGSYTVVLTGVSPDDFGTTSPSPVQFTKGIGTLTLKPKKSGTQILWFSIVHPDYPAINPVVITPLMPLDPPVTPPAPSPTTPPSISLHPDSPYTFSATYGYSAQTSLNIIVGNDGARPTGELAVRLSGKDSTSFTISSNKVTSIAVSGSATLRLTPLLGLKAKTYTVTVTVSGNNIAEKKELVVNFKVNPESCIPFKEIAVALWDNNTLTVINNPANNSVKSTFSEFTWFRDGQEIITGQSLSGNENGDPLPSGKYHVELAAENGSRFVSCEYEIPKPKAAPKTSPIDFSDVETVDVYSISGKHLARLNVQGSFPTEIRNFKNAYVLVLKNKIGTKKAIRAAEVLR
jgi:hypothetical protein